MHEALQSGSLEGIWNCPLEGPQLPGVGMQAMPIGSGLGHAGWLVAEVWT